jgi:NADH-quinone oxidoreductase subunit L
MTGLAVLACAIPAAPLVGSAVASLSPRRAPWWCVSGVSLSVVFAIAALVAVARGARAVASTPWMRAGGRALDLSLELAPSTALAATMVAATACFVVVYAVPYIAGDPRAPTFLTVLTGFAGAMLALVLAGDLVTLFIAWELVGVCSWFLIGYHRERAGVPEAATKALVVTRLGDLAMLGGIVILVAASGTGGINAIVSHPPRAGVAFPAALLFVGAASKSAQLPFQGWLPDAMVGPAPVSALLHSSTMVAAGVFLLVRLFPLFATIPELLDAIAWTGALTSIFAGAAALVQQDLKRTLAYSTMSQLGLMFVAVGARSPLAALFLLVAHASYKTLLFLVAGAVEHAVGGTSFASTGGLARRMPYAFGAFAVGTLALSGLPATLALPPKEPVVAAAGSIGGTLVWAVLLSTVLTGAYAARMLVRVFFGAVPAPAREAKAPRSLVAPAVALAALVPAVLLANGALIGRPLAALLGATTPEAPVALTAVALCAAAAGVAIGGLAEARWRAPALWPGLARMAPVLSADLGLAAVYRVSARAAVALASALAAVDAAVFDRASEGAACAAVAGARAARAFDTRVLDRAASASGRGALRFARDAGRFDASTLDGGVRAAAHELVAGSAKTRHLQTGRVDEYLLPAFAWVGAAVVALLLWAWIR